MKYDDLVNNILEQQTNAISKTIEQQKQQNLVQLPNGKIVEADPNTAPDIDIPYSSQETNEPKFYYGDELLQKQKDELYLLYVIIQLVDPTPYTSIPDLSYSIYEYRQNPSNENLTDMLFGVLAMVPYLELGKIFALLKAGGRAKAKTEMFKYFKDNYSKVLNYVKSKYPDKYNNVEFALRSLVEAYK